MSPERKLEYFDSYPSAVESLLDEPWTDGLPIVVSTPELVDAMIVAGGRPGDEVLGTVASRELSVHVWEAATCAVMAGCKPEYFPVVLATWDAMLDPRMNLHGALGSTGGAAFAAVVSGPYAETIGMRSGTGVFGPGNRANATIGRAIRLCAMSVLKAIPGQTDGGSFGHGGKYSFHFAEGARPSGWKSIREQLGYSPSSTTVSILPAEAPRQVMHRWNPSPQDMLNALGTAMRDPVLNVTGSKTAYIVVLGPEHAGVLADGGLTPADIRKALSEISAISIEQLAAAGIRHDAKGSRFCAPDAQGRMMTARPEHILVMTAGGAGAGWSSVIPGWAWVQTCHPVTRAVLLPGQPVETRNESLAELDFA